MRYRFVGLILLFLPLCITAQDLSEGLIVNDLSLHPMEDLSKPAYLSSIIDPSFNTRIRRITNAQQGEVIVPMYSTIQAWNADESLMILYNQSIGSHILLDGMDYSFIEILDIDPLDLEQVFWDFNEPDILYYPKSGSYDFIKYSIDTQSKQSLANLAEISGCTGNIAMGNDVQMMSWDSDVLTFRCDNEDAYSYRISTGAMTTFTMDDVQFAAPGVAPSGNRYYHSNSIYDNSGTVEYDLNKASVEHSCLGKLTNGNDAYFAIAFAEGPEGGCIGDIIAHDMITGDCFPIISQSQGYDYPQSGTHISALAHKNTEGGWIAASMIGYDQDGQKLLDQELVIVNANEGDIKVCRIGHHRSDEDQYDYWGEPHAVISPTGTRVLFASDWSGDEDGQSVDSYVVELPVFTNTINSVDDENAKNNSFSIYPNPSNGNSILTFTKATSGKIQILDALGHEISNIDIVDQRTMEILLESSGVYIIHVTTSQQEEYTQKIIVIN